ncbi:DUF2163 domain-containing protein [Palleronia sediminis]|uniref:DUF2163 domain-containing protein n=1 Tax=Palleronia sediminis TaxID=2547833 RepID=A0A4R6A7C3_9RHOB|nr:DUF2163 domain-containing protein [Palleronia sediminis]TDL79560.1 DUF2163 domain-containing protein [Palleronia sediminis]
MSALAERLAGGCATLCRCWRVTRADGRAWGFTDHDRPLRFAGTEFAPGEGLSATALQQGTGLAVDNGEAAGILSDGGITEADIAAGRFDGAEVEAWLVDWAEPPARLRVFRGTLGEIERSGGAFRAELRGLSDALNQPFGRVYQGQCSAELGDRACGVDSSDPAFAVEAGVRGLPAPHAVELRALGGYAEGWFTHGTIEPLEGAARGLVRRVKLDAPSGEARRLELAQSLPGLAVGDRVRLVAGCDRRAATCRAKFANMANFRGFPHLPGEDWLTAHPAAGHVDRPGLVRGFGS